ncbi:glycosyltransferase family 92 protein [Limosilactobacillus panis]|uniref:Glycosyltransferase family 92 protein n=1 Tax=Limosilactobacillus panis TaxID=47493 RepID=A0ABT7VP33_9LACO|nr:glycosyltransferase family 92 protein [Limosilactobacillus panis]MDM8334498.1 glycosyltransferase family 92 protein [Limosilactobacillus panis]
MIKNRKVTENKYFIFDNPKQNGLIYLIKFFITKIECFFYKFILLLANPVDKQKKYDVVLCAIFKNEAPYLREWIEYHLIVGVDHFYLYNNDSDDNYKEVLKPYIDEEKVTLIDFPYKHAQMKAYCDCIEKFRKSAKWIGFLDIDEFVVPIKYNSIYDFLENFNNRPSVKLYWKVFGTSGLINRDVHDLVTEDFKIAWPKYDEVGKCFYNTRFNVNVKSPKMKTLHHIFWGNWNGIDIPPVNCFDSISLRGFDHVKSSEFPIQINHYFTKSYNEYFGVKAKKGDVFYKKNHYISKSFFYRHEMLCTKEDNNIFKYIIKLKLAMH